MKRFFNLSNQQNEYAIRHGIVAPAGTVNLAFTKTPPLSPGRNLVVIDTSGVNDIQVSNINGAFDKKLFFANFMGVLEDENGNQVVLDEHPIVTDKFTIEEDWSQEPGSEYTAQHILPYRHISRYFHLDRANMSADGHSPVRYTGNKIKVVSENGQQHLDKDGKPLYKIELIPVAPQSYRYQDNGLSLGRIPEWPYRVHVYLDSDTDETLWVYYNKVEIDSNGHRKKYRSGHSERLNPLPFFEYQVEESEVVDPVNRFEKFYATKPINLKDQIAGTAKAKRNGFKVYVPRKAVPDPRIFQLFRWRLRCDFVQPYRIDQIDEPKIIPIGPPPPKVEPSGFVPCGVVITNNDKWIHPKTNAPFALYNLEKSYINKNKLVFYNPLNNSKSAIADDSTKSKADYWLVNFDTISDQDLAKFRFLIWAPWTAKFDFAPYVKRIKYFVEDVGGTLFIDTNNNTLPENLFGITTTNPVSPYSGAATSTGSSGGYVHSNTLEVIPFTGSGINYDRYLTLPGKPGSFCYMDDTVGTSFTGDCEVRVCLAIAPCQPPDTISQTIIAKWQEDGNGRSWRLDMNEKYQLQWRWSEDGMHDYAVASSYEGLIKRHQPKFYFRLGERPGSLSAIDQMSNISLPFKAVVLHQTGAIANDDNDSVRFRGQPGTFGSGRASGPVTGMPLGDYTLEGWVKTSWTKAPQNIIHYTGGSVGLPPGRDDGADALKPAVHIKVNVDGTVSLNSGINRLEADATSAAKVNDGEWHHIAVTRQSNSISIYIDGAESGTGADDFRLTEKGTLTIGNDNQQAYPFNGHIDEIAIYNYALTAKRIKEHYQVGKGILNPADIADIAVGIPTSVPVISLEKSKVKWIRVTHDVDDGKGNNIVTFYTSDNGREWQVIGQPTMNPGITKIYDSNARVTIGAYGDAGRGQPMKGKVYEAKLYNKLQKVTNNITPWGTKPPLPD